METEEKCHLTNIRKPKFSDRGPLPRDNFLMIENGLPLMPDENFPIIMIPYPSNVHDITEDLCFFTKMREDIELRDLDYVALFKIGVVHEKITCDLPRENEIVKDKNGTKYTTIKFEAKNLPHDKAGYVARVFSSGKMIAETQPFLFYDSTVEGYSYQKVIYTDTPERKPCHASEAECEQPSDSECQSNSVVERTKFVKKKNLIQDAMDDFPRAVETLVAHTSISKMELIEDDMDSHHSFDGTAESEYIAVEDPLDPGLIVFKSRVDEMKDEICKLTREKNELEMKLTLSNENILLLKRELEKVDAVASHLHNCNKVLENSVQKLKEELQQYESGIQLQQMHSEKLQHISEDITMVKSMVVDIKESSVHICNIHKMMENISSSLMYTNPQPHNAILDSVQGTSDNNEAYVNEDVRNPTYDLPSTSEVAIDLTVSLASNSNNESQMPTVLLVQNESANNCSNDIILENDALRNELNVVKEENASLKSRVSVLEVELSCVSQNTYPLLMSCMQTYEKENSLLKTSLEKQTKELIKLDSLQKELESLKYENHLLKSRIDSSPGDHENYLISQLQELQDNLRTASQEKEYLKTQLMELRRDTVGKVNPQFRNY